MERKTMTKGNNSNTNRHHNTKPCRALAQWGASGTGWHLLALVGTDWHWLAVVGSGWQWLAFVGTGWQWLALVGTGWYCLAVVGTGWLWFVLVGSGWHWLALIGTDWHWLAMVGRAAWGVGATLSGRGSSEHSNCTALQRGPFHFRGRGQEHINFSMHSESAHRVPGSKRIITRS